MQAGEQRGYIVEIQGAQKWEKSRIFAIEAQPLTGHLPATSVALCNTTITTFWLRPTSSYYFFGIQIYTT